MSTANRKLRAGIVGGGRGAFIGAVHRIAAELDGAARVVAGAMSADPANARASAEDWNLDRSYDSFESMAQAERGRADGIDFVIIATPNHLHYPAAKAFLEAGIPVICDKPLAFSLQEAEGFVQLVEKGSTLFALTHNYTGYPLVRHARELVREGSLGELRKVLVEYNQDWLMSPLEREGNKQAQWRTDPKRAGISGCVGDIGTHAANLLEFISGRRIQSVCADLTAFVPGRQLEDDANMLVRLEGGAKGSLVCSQVACGEENRAAHPAVRVARGPRVGAAGTQHAVVQAGRGSLAAASHRQTLPERGRQPRQPHARGTSGRVPGSLRRPLPAVHRGRAPRAAGRGAVA
ncbi:MAG: Gfo/Idh/MocA family oxidoreductase [Steroidobacteraceae bacterium]